MANYINPFTDIGFKRIFGQELSKPLLIAFLNFRRPDIGEEFRTDVMLMNKKSKEIFSDKLRLVYLQLPLFEKGVDECENDFDRWIYVLKNMETIKRLPWAAQNSVFQKLAEIADISSLTKEERLYYDVALRKYRDTLCVLESAEQRGLKKGREEGLAKGLAKGRAEGRLEIARNMKADGMSIELIQKYSGLSPEEIAQL